MPDRHKMPVVFLGHGNPMNALTQNAYSEAWASLGSKLRRPKAILMISAHWYIPELAVTAMANPKTLHDFGGFPKQLFEVKYPAPGNPELATRVQSLLDPLPCRLDEEWGLDHGTWSVLCHVYPDAKVPVVQLSLDRNQSPQFHYDLGKKLTALRDEDVLVMGSGNIVHNLRQYAWGQPQQEAFYWAERFDDLVCEHLTKGSVQPLIDYGSLGEDASLSIPTPDHYLPLLVILGLVGKGEKVKFPVDGFDGGSMSMRACMWG